MHCLTLKMFKRHPRLHILCLGVRANCYLSIISTSLTNIIIQNVAIGPELSFGEGIMVDISCIYYSGHKPVYVHSVYP